MAVSPEALARATLARMSLEQKVGQVFMLGFVGTRVTEQNRALIHGLRLGGVTLFGRNIETAQQVRQLTAGLQEFAEPVPLFISIDQEGGLVVRVTSGATIFPGNMAIGAADDLKLAHAVAAASADELRAMGITMNLAPVVDVNTNARNPVIGTRSFGGDAARVADFAVATIDGTQAQGVSAVAKHFPGHGDTDVDSHRDLPLVAHPLERLQALELVPFQAAIRAGVDGIMTAHVYAPAIEPRPNVPATLSKAVLTDLLRDRLGYDGLILTDALDMGAITNYRSSAEAAVDAFLAGADLLLIAGVTERDHQRLGDGPRLLLEAVRAGRVSVERLDASVLRVLLAKARRGVLPGAGLPSPSADAVGRVAHRELALDVARKAVTLLRDSEGLLPLDRRQRIGVVVAGAAPRTGVQDDVQAGSLLAAIQEFAPRSFSVGSPRATNAEVIVLGTYDLAQHADQHTLARALAASGKPVIGVALRGPYDAAAVPEIGTFVAVYGDRPVHLQAAAEALFGELTPTGQVP